MKEIVYNEDFFSFSREKHGPIYIEERGQDFTMGNSLIRQKQESVKNSNDCIINFSNKEDAHSAASLRMCSVFDIWFGENGNM
eukprot:snap_masked-scaffold_10-processed-gene-12.38-mRNA-1 protein AED:1.00 eAED:1.00 QI:0/0/0/0/1/1/2/0/82